MTTKKQYIEDFGKKVSDFINSDLDTGKKIVSKAIDGREVQNKEELPYWFENRFKPNVVFIDRRGYARMCVDALKILSTTAPTDFGLSRQRDLGQLWADMTRGYLGELAFVKFLQNKWGIEAELAHEQGELERFLPTDISEIKRPNEAKLRDPRMTIGIKTIKWNGIWFDIPGDQFNHTDVHVLVKVGTGRDHLFAFFKEISVFKDKVLRQGLEEGVLTENKAQELFDDLPDFTPMPGYVVGFVYEKNFENGEFGYDGRMGRKHFNIDLWAGEYRESFLDKIKEEKEVQGKVKFDGIGSFSHSRAFVFNTGSLNWGQGEWKDLMGKI